MPTPTLVLCVKRAMLGVLVAGLLAAAPTHKPIRIGVLYTPKVASMFGGSAALQALAETNIRDQINEGLVNSDLVPSEGYRVEVVMIPLPATMAGVDPDTCDLSEIHVRLLRDKAIAVRRNKAKVSVVWLLVQCHDTPAPSHPLPRSAVSWAPLYPAEYKDPSIGFVVAVAGAVDSSSNRVATHEFGHLLGGHHPGFELEDIVLQTRHGKPIPSPYLPWAQGINLPIATVNKGAPRSDAMGIHGGAGNFYSHPGVEAWGRTGDATHDVARAIRMNWDALVDLGGVPWKPPTR
jgi:hypothetical protein